MSIDHVSMRSTSSSLRRHGIDSSSMPIDAKFARSPTLGASVGAGMPLRIVDLGHQYKHDDRQDPRLYPPSQHHHHARQSSSSRYPPSAGPSSHSHDDRDRHMRSSRSHGYDGSSPSSSSWGLPSIYDDGRRISHNHHSPASTSSSSTASSLRTPPDLLNGASIDVNWKASASLLGGNGKQAVVPRLLDLSQLEKRLDLLGTLPKRLDPALPSPPSSPKRSREPSGELSGSSAATRKSSTGAKKRKEVMDAEPSDRDRNRTTPKSSLKRSRAESPSPPTTKGKGQARASVPSTKGETRRHSPTTNSSSKPKASPTGEASSKSGSSQEPAAPPLKRPAAPPRPKSWTKEKYQETAALYRNRGRELKHSGDRRMREASVASSSYGAPHPDAEVAALEQTDALLLYVYSFWCDDQAGGGGSTCVASNWQSIFGLLRYVRERHEKLGTTALVGLCRLLEAMVLQHLTNHERRLLHHRMTKITKLPHASGSSPADSSAPSPASTPSPAGGDGSSSGTTTISATTLPELAEAMSKLVADSERTTKLFVLSHQQLSLSVLRNEFPSTWATCMSSEMDPFTTATAVDPGVEMDNFAWPIEHITPMPHVVCFGRTLIAEQARRRRLKFSPITLEHGANAQPQTHS